MRDRCIIYALVVILCGLLLCAFDLRLSWDRNTEGDLGGYNVSYDSPTSGRWTDPHEPYEYNSMGLPVIDGFIHTTTFTIEDAAPGNYAFYVRAYDTSGNMSSYNAYAGNASEDEGWTTAGISEPDNCVPVPTVTVNRTVARVPFRLIVQAAATNSPTSISIDGESVGEKTYVYTTGGRRHIEVRAQNDTWYGVTWQEIEGIPVDSSTGRGGAGAGFR